MIEVVRERRVAAPPAEVWDVVAAPQRAPEWFAFADRVEVLDGDGVGQRRRRYAGPPALRAGARQRPERPGDARVRDPRRGREHGPLAGPVGRALSRLAVIRGGQALVSSRSPIISRRSSKSRHSIMAR